jgi:hypothetical protein
MASDFVQRFLHIVELERLDDGFDLFHFRFPESPKNTLSLSISVPNRIRQQEQGFGERIIQFLPIKGAE